MVGERGCGTNGEQRIKVGEVEGQTKDGTGGWDEVAGIHPASLPPRGSISPCLFIPRPSPAHPYVRLTTAANERTSERSSPFLDRRRQLEKGEEAAADQEGEDVVADLRRRPPDVRDRGPPPHLRRHRRPRRRCLGSERRLPRVQAGGDGQHHEGLRRARVPRPDRPLPWTHQVHGHPRRTWRRHPRQEGIGRRDREEDRAGAGDRHLRRADDPRAVQHGGREARRLPRRAGPVDRHHHTSTVQQQTNQRAYT